MSTLWKPLEYDTKLFGFVTAKIESVDGDDVETLIAQLIKNGVNYATYRVPSDNFTLIHALEQHGFLLVDGFIELTHDLQNISECDLRDGLVRSARASDVPSLRSIAQSTFVYNRFYNDPLIAKNKANTLFADWIENSVAKKAADDVLVYEKGRRITGFVSIKYSGEITLVAVSKDAQGQGVAKTLISHALHALKTENLPRGKAGRKQKTAIIDTQVQNIPAMRTYLACGFKPESTFFTYRWSNINI